MFNIRTENICYINVQKANSCALKSPPTSFVHCSNEAESDNTEEMKKSKKKKDKDKDKE